MTGPATGPTCGEGTVYRARQDGLDRFVAVTVIDTGTTRTGTRAS